jgi:hypothetical protein
MFASQVRTAQHVATRVLQTFLSAGHTLDAWHCNQALQAQRVRSGYKINESTAFRTALDTLEPASA